MYIGVDIGTSVTKAVGYDDTGTQQCVYSVPTDLTFGAGGRVEQDIDAVAASVAAVVRPVADALGSRPELLALTGQGDGCWLLAADGAAARPAASWLDGRASGIVDAWLDDGTADLILQRNGGMVFPGASAAILAALNNDEPEVLDAAETATHCVGVIFQRLTGERAIDVSDASFPFLDPVAREYDSQILSACGLADHERLLPPVTPTGGPAAPLTAAAASTLGLPEEIPVSAGPYDLLSCARGAGVTEPGDGLLIIGTTLACQVVTDDPTSRPHRAGLLLGMWAQNRWMRAMPAMVGTASLDWLLGLTGISVDDLPELLDGSPPGANGVRVLPYWSASGERAPFVDGSARGRIDGLHLGTSRADVVRGLCESLALAARHCFEAAGLTGRLAVCGGGAQSDGWIQMFADVLGRPLDVVETPQAGAYGAVISGLEARGQAPGWPVDVRTVEPVESRRPLYDDAYGDYVARVDWARREWSVA